MDASTNICGHMINFFYGFLDKRGGTNCPMALLAPVSPTPNRNPVFKYEAGDLALVCDAAVGAIATLLALFWLAVV